MMPDHSQLDKNRDVSLFSRASLQLTFDLLRKNHPQLALEVRNITGGTPHSRDPDAGDDRNGDNFRVDLPSQRVREVVQGLMEFTQPDAVDICNPEINIMARTLMQDWLILAHKLVASQPLFPELEPQAPKSPNPQQGE